MHGSGKNTSGPVLVPGKKKTRDPLEDRGTKNSKECGFSREELTCLLKFWSQNLENCHTFDDLKILLLRRRLVV